MHKQWSKISSRLSQIWDHFNSLEQQNNLLLHLLYYYMERLSMLNETQKKASNIKEALAYARYLKDRNWRFLQQSKSILLSKLDELSKKSEDELTKTELYALINVMFFYMKSLNLYKYYRDEVTKLLVDKVEEKPIEEAEINEWF